MDGFGGPPRPRRRPGARANGLRAAPRASTGRWHAHNRQAFTKATSQSGTPWDGCNEKTCNCHEETEIETLISMQLYVRTCRGEEP